MALIFGFILTKLAKKRISWLVCVGQSNEQYFCKVDEFFVLFVAEYLVSFCYLCFACLLLTYSSHFSSLLTIRLKKGSFLFLVVRLLQMISRLRIHGKTIFLYSFIPLFDLLPIYSKCLCIVEHETL